VRNESAGWSNFASLRLVRTTGWHSSRSPSCNSTNPLHPFTSNENERQRSGR
jgi:hypothetical protein